MRSRVERATLRVPCGSLVRRADPHVGATVNQKPTAEPFPREIEPSGAIRPGLLAAVRCGVDPRLTHKFDNRFSADQWPLSLSVTAWLSAARWVRMSSASGIPRLV
jgi:hypothetical protein